jgi:hypothetical protein
MSSKRLRRDPFLNQESVMKNHRFTIIAGALLLGAAATTASAQSSSRAQAFASQFQQMQALSTNSASSAFKPQPVQPAVSADPVGRVSFADRVVQFQAQSASSGGSADFKPAPTIAAQAADPVGHESFGDRFAQMQAESSNSGEFKALASGEETTYANAGRATATDRPTFAQRVAQLLHRGSATPSQSSN